MDLLNECNDLEINIFSFVPYPYRNIPSEVQYAANKANGYSLNHPRLFCIKKNYSKSLLS